MLVYLKQRTYFCNPKQKIINNKIIYSDEKNFSTIKQKEKKQTRFSLKNGYCEWSQSACFS